MAETVFLHFSLIKKHKHFFSLFILTNLLTLFLQWQTTQKSQLTQLSSTETVTQTMRLNEYPPIKIPVAWWLEGRNESIAYRKIERNFFEIMDINQYFFANHPRERTNTLEFEKFPYIFLPFFLFGLLTLIPKLKKPILLLSLFLPIITLSIIGNINSLGPFSLFPIISLCLIEGLSTFHQKLQHIPKTAKIVILLTLVVFITTVFLQTIAYAIN